MGQASFIRGSDRSNAWYALMHKCTAFPPCDLYLHSLGHKMLCDPRQFASSNDYCFVGELKPAIKTVIESRFLDTARRYSRLFGDGGKNRHGWGRVEKKKMPRANTPPRVKLGTIAPWGRVVYWWFGPFGSRVGRNRFQKA